MTYLASDSYELPLGVTLRRANFTDAERIKQMVREEGLNPLDLNWSRFWVIENEGRLIACGQLRPYKNFQELKSLIVDDNFRKRGLGTYLVRHLMKQTSVPLYLSCGNGSLCLSFGNKKSGNRIKNFYKQIGFIQISWWKVPFLLKPEFGLSKLIATVKLRRLAYMQYLPREDKN